MWHAFTVTLGVGAVWSHVCATWRDAAKRVTRCYVPLGSNSVPWGLHQVWCGYLGAGPKVCLTGLEFAPCLLAERTPRRRGLMDQTLTQCCGHFWAFFVMTSSVSWACRCGMVLACGVPEGESVRAGWWPCVWHHVGSI